MAQNVVRTHSRSRSFTALATGGSMLTAGAGVGTLATALFIGLAGPAGATTLTVSNTLDSGAGSLRQAIISANAAAGTDTINFASGVSGTITLASDLPDVTESLTITGPGSAALTISGDGIHHAFALKTVGDGTVTISGLTITNSVRHLSAFDGGAIDAVDTSVNLDDVVLSNNSVDSTSDGGAISVNNTAGIGTVTITNSVISHNSATGSGDGGGGVVIFADEVTITNTKIDHNDAAEYGGIIVSANSVTIKSTTIADNTDQSFVGGLAVQSRHLTLSDSVISGNTSVGGSGGVYLFDMVYKGSGPGTTSITNTRISDNSGGWIGGGAIASLYRVHSTDIDALTVTGNQGGTTGPFGDSNVGGLAILGDVTLSNSTIADNIGLGIDVIGPAGVAINSTLAPSATLRPTRRAFNYDTTLTVAHSTISGNSLQGIASKGFGPRPSSTPSALSPSGPAPTPSVITVTLDHVLAANNGVEDVALPATATFSLIETPNASLIAGTGTVTGVDPGLLPLQDVSDTVSVVPIAMGGAAWNAGNPNFTPPPATDQRGLPRVVDIIDIGAYEVQDPFVLPKFTG